MGLPVIVGILILALAAAYKWVQSKIDSAKDAILNNEVKEQKEKSDESVKDARASADAFLARMQHYEQSSGGTDDGDSASSDASNGDSGAENSGDRSNKSRSSGEDKA